MTFVKKIWKNRVSEYPTRRKLVKTSIADVYDVERQEGTIMTEGDAFSEANMNDLEERIASAFKEVQSEIIVNVLADAWQTSTVTKYAWEQTVLVAGMTDSTKVYVYPTHDGLSTAEEIDDYDAVYPLIDIDAESVDGGLKLWCVKEAPEIDIKILIEGIGG